MFGQGIWFGNKTRNELIYSNQCQSFGVIICDDPKNKCRYVGVEDDDIFLLHMEGTTYGKMSRDITDEELEYAPR